MNKKSNLFKALSLGVALGLVIVAAENIFKIPHEVIRKGYLIAAPLIIILSMGVNVIWQTRFQNKIKALMPILVEQENPDLFIDENEKLLKTIKHPYNKALLLINISAGYSDKKEYEKAREALLSIPEKGIRGINGVIYYVDLVHYNFKLMNTAEAIVLMDKHKKEFEAFENHKIIGKHIKMNKVLYLRAKEQFEEADLLLKQLEEEETDKRFLKDLEELKKEINNA